MNLDKLDYILTVAEEQNLTRAARKLYISQPALTNYLNKLEDQLGVKLFDRSSSPITVTKAGALYIERMKRIQQEAENLYTDLAQLSRKQVIFHLGIGSTRGNHWLPLFLPEFCRRHPDVMIQLHEEGEAELETHLCGGILDLAVGNLNTSYPDLVYEDIAKESVLLAIPRSYDCVRSLPECEGTPSNPHFITAEKIGTIPFLMPYPGRGFHRCATAQLEKHHVVPGRIVQYASMNTAYRLAGAGVGAMFMTPVTDFLDTFAGVQKNLAFCTLQNPPLSRRSVLAYHPGNRNMDLVRDMANLILERVPPCIIDAIS